MPLYLYRPPQLRVNRVTGRETGDARVSWVELFFDLLFVVVIGQLSGYLSAMLDSAGKDIIVQPRVFGLDREWSMLICFVVYYANAISLWLDEVMFQGRFGSFVHSDIIDRVLMFVQLWSSGGLATVVSGGLGDRYMYRGGVFTILFLVPFVLKLSRAVWATKDTHPVHIWIVPMFGRLVRLVLYIISLYMPNRDQRVIVIMCAMTFQYVSNWAQHQYIDELWPRSLEHDHERMGLVSLVVMGEAITGVSMGIRVSMDNNLLRLCVTSLGLAMIIYSWWWIYFDSHYETHLIDMPNKARIWHIAHYLFFVSVVSMSAGIEQLASHHHRVLSQRIKIWSFLWFALVLVSLQIITSCRWTLDQLLNDMRRHTIVLMIITVTSVVLPFTSDMTGLGAVGWLTLLSVVSVIVNVIWGQNPSIQRSNSDDGYISMDMGK